MAVATSTPRVALVGPHPESRGGVAATMRAIADGCADAFSFVVVPTQIDASATAKVRAGAAGLRSLAALCRRGEVDLVHVHVSAGVSFARKAAAVAIARRHRTPVIVHVHGGGFGAQIRGTGRRGAMGRRALRGTLRSADAVVALTRSWAAELSRFAAVDAYVIPNAPDIDPEPLARAAAGPPTVAYLGHLYADKGVYELVDAVAAVRRTHPDVRLVLAGQGRERERLLEVGRERLGDAVELPGWLMGPAKRELLATATCLALPSYHEGLPLVVLEAMHAGLPVVATPVGGVPEVARDGEEALLVPPRDVPALADALGRVLGDAGLRERLGAAARARAEAEYSVDAFRDRVGTLYRAVLER